MKRSILYSLMAVLLVLTGRVNVNEKYDLDGVADPTNVASFEEKFAGDYPSEGYFTSKAQLTETVSKWLMSKYLACDKGSTAKISVKFGSVGYVLTNEDYESMGKEAGQPGKYHNFDYSMDVDTYITAFLASKFPNAGEGALYKIGYKYYSNKVTTDMERVYELESGTWILSTATGNVEDCVAMMNFEGYTKGWILDKLVGSIAAFTLEKADYQALLDWVLKNKEGKGSNGQGYIDDRYDPVTAEYWFGVSTYYPNINNLTATWKNYYNPDGYLDNMSTDEILAMMEERLQWGFINIVLPRLVEAPDENTTYEIHYTLYNDAKQTVYPYMTFKWDGSKYNYASGPLF